jgi:hypothetical protein
VAMVGEQATAAFAGGAVVALVPAWSQTARSP